MVFDALCKSALSTYICIKFECFISYCFPHYIIGVHRTIFSLSFHFMKKKMVNVKRSSSDVHQQRSSTCEIHLHLTTKHWSVCFKSFDFCAERNGTIQAINFRCLFRYFAESGYSLSEKMLSNGRSSELFTAKYIGNIKHYYIKHK